MDLNGSKYSFVNSIKFSEFRHSGRGYCSSRGKLPEGLSGITVSNALMMAQIPELLLAYGHSTLKMVM